MSFYWKTRTLLSGDYREIERDLIAYKNDKVIKKYSGKQPIYCIIRLFSDEGGLFCLFVKALAGISYSLQHDYIPVIDMQSKENIFFDKKQRKQNNAWEKFFKQPGGVSYGEIKGRHNCIVIENPIGPSNLFELSFTPETVQYWRKLCSKYIQYSDDVNTIIDKYSRIFDMEDRVLGVLARGTDYLNPGVGHPVQPNIQEIIQHTIDSMKKNQCNKVFLATEDEKILERMRDEFGENLFYVDQKRYDGVQKDKLGHLRDYKSDAIEMNQAYLTAIYFLSRCCCFFGGITTGTVGAYLLSSGYEDFELWYKGSYGTSDAKTLDISKL